MKHRFIANRHFVLGVLLCLFAFCPVYASSAVIEGVILSEKGPILNAEVRAYQNFHDIINKDPSYTSTAGEKPGFYKLELAPGKYWLIASGQVDGKEYFSFHGANPIEAGTAKLWMPFMAVPETRAFKEDNDTTVLFGEVTFNGEPVNGAYVSVYPVTNRSFRGLGYLTNRTIDDGSFRIRPEPGEYIVIARKRIDYPGIRPLKKGDLFCYFAANPVKVLAGKSIGIEIPCYPKDDLKAFLDKDVYHEIMVKRSSDDSVRFREKIHVPHENILRIRGRVTGLENEPEKGIYVMAYKGDGSGIFRMHFIRTMPDSMTRTDENGEYSLDIAQKGVYHVVARELVGEAPVKGELHGLYEGNADYAVALDRTDLDGIDIVVSEVMAGPTDILDRRSQIADFTTNDKSKIKNLKSKIQDREYGNWVIDRDTLWSGEILISGTVHVKRGVTLTIDPGTKVRFKKTDKDNDGVGDAKIRVSGRLLAVGRPDKMIEFVSAEDRPAKMDWSYVLLFVSGDESVIEYCRFRDAFTGVQVHFSKAVIKDSVFTDNHEAIRFGRAELGIEHNDIIGNSLGIRHTRLEGPVRVTYNNIQKNSVGIFLVPSNQNTVGFTETFDKKHEKADTQPVVSRNNIAYNETYNYRLGERQGYDISLERNWWGSVSDSGIAGLIYDGEKDSDLGRVIYKPYARFPFENAGVRAGGQDD